MYALAHGLTLDFRMHFPKWAPAELVELYREIKPRADAERKRYEEFEKAGHADVDWKTYLESGQELPMGSSFVGEAAHLEILEALITNPVMEATWRNLLKRSSSFRLIRMSFGGKTQVRNLLGACLRAEMNWLNVPKLTRTESVKLHEDIAAQALKLCSLLVETRQTRELVDTRKYLTSEKLQDFIDSLESDGHEIWHGIEGHIDHLLFELLPPVPRILMELHKRALEHAQYPYAVSQPNAPNARLNYFIASLHDYFTKAYGLPLHSHVAALVSAVFHEHVDEDRVRALLRSRKTASRERARKKFAKMKKEIPG